MSHEVLGATSIHVVLQYSDNNENLPFHSLFEVLFDLWQTITATMTDHVSVRLNGFFCNTQYDNIACKQRKIMVYYKIIEELRAL